MPVITVNPLSDTRWDELVARHPRGSVFHTSGWLWALQQTYAYDPIVFTTCGPGEPLSNGLVFCKVRSWMTGRRLVSLPFSDHCDLLTNSAGEQAELLAYVCESVARDDYDHAEIRPAAADESEHLTVANLQPSKTFCLHKVQLDEPIEKLFHNLHQSCIQRKIRRAEKEDLIYNSGRSELLVQKFYDLLLRTRRRHSLPPQPLRWFRNLLESMGESLTIRLVSKNDRPLAAMLTLAHKTTAIYKYGCSDERFHSLGGTPFLFWKTIQESKAQGLRVLDLGRSDLDQAGLVEFKNRLGASRTTLTYWRYPAMRSSAAMRSNWRAQVAKDIFSWMPDPVFVASGRFLYRHIG